MGPEFENGDGRLRPSRQQRLPGAEGPPEGRSTAPRHAACGGPIPRSRGPVLIFMLRTCHSRGRRRLSSKGDAPLRIESHVSRTAHTKTTHAHTSCARLPSWCNERGWQIARPQTGKRDRTLPRTRAAPKFGLFIHLGTGTRCPHSACLARHTPVLTRSAKYSRHQHS